MLGADVTHQLEAVGERLAQLSAALAKDDLSDPALSRRTRTELSAALRDLQAIKSALHHQNEELVAARQTAEVQRRRYQDLFEFAPDGYIVTDMEGTVWEANQAAATLLQVEQSALTRKPLIVFVAEAQRPQFRARLTELRGQTGTVEWEMHLQARNGQIIHAAAKVAVVRSPEGLPLSMRWLFHDVSERKRSEEQIRQFNQQLERRVQERTAELEAANRLKDEWLLREQVARAAVEAAQARLAFLAEASHVLASSLDYRTTLDHVAHLAVPHLADWCIVSLVEDDGSIRPVAIGHTEPKKIEQLRELYRRHAINPEGTEGSARVIRTGKPKLYTHIKSADLAAIARDKEHLRHLRELEPRSAVVMPLIARGRTLGAIILVSAESGRTYGPADLPWLEDLAGRVATAIDNARLYQEMQEARQQAQSRGDATGRTAPAKESKNGQPAPTEKPASAPACGNSATPESHCLARRVLVVDDNVDAVDTLAMLLHLWGHQVDVAHSADEALRLAREHVPDLVLMDIGLPGMNGYDLARQMRTELGHHHPLLVALTGYGQEEDRRRSREAGIDMHFLKPVNPGVLQKILEQLPVSA